MKTCPCHAKLHNDMNNPSSKEAVFRFLMCDITMIMVWLHDIFYSFRYGHCCSKAFLDSQNDLWFCNNNGLGIPEKQIDEEYKAFDMFSANKKAKLRQPSSY